MKDEDIYLNEYIEKSIGEFESEEYKNEYRKYCRKSLGFRLYLIDCYFSDLREQINNSMKRFFDLIIKRFG